MATLQDLRKNNPEGTFEGGTDCDVGVILSLHNIAISAPQIVAAVVCSGIFWVVQLMGGSDATGWTLRIGGLAALGAAWLSRGLSRDL